jgi:hypothetical protein
MNFKLIELLSVISFIVSGGNLLLVIARILTVNVDTIFIVADIILCAAIIVLQYLCLRSLKS